MHGFPTEEGELVRGGGVTFSLAQGSRAACRKEMSGE